MSKYVERAKVKFAEVLATQANNIAATCKKLKISRSTYDRLMRTDKDFKRSVDDAMEAVIDNAECKLQDAINEGNVQAIMFFLKTKAKHRGYIERDDGGSNQVQNFAIVVDGKATAMEVKERDYEVEVSK